MIFDNVKKLAIKRGDFHLALERDLGFSNRVLANGMTNERIRKVPESSGLSGVVTIEKDVGGRKKKGVREVVEVVLTVVAGF